MEELPMATLAFKPLDWFKLGPQPRKQFDESDLRQLGESLKVKQLQPVLAREDGCSMCFRRGLEP
jgi:ParB family transcriptional regulator, chromosome partitioning protein